jgi:spermidine/putrescine transport system ATP-binding protein
LGEQTTRMSFSAVDFVKQGLLSMVGLGKSQGEWPASKTFEKNQDSDEFCVEGVYKYFGEIAAVRDVHFKVKHGEFLTILGPSGCGKTTLLRILAGLELPDGGQVILKGARITDLPANRRPVNTVFQNYALFPHLNVYENVAFGLRSRKFPQSEVDPRVNQALAMLQLESFAKRYAHQLSGGQKQRVALARTLVNEPELLLLDEPMSALDAKLRGEVQLELRRLQRRLGKTFILVTHDQDEAMTVSDRIIVMRDGRIEQSGPPCEVYERPVNRFVAEFLGSANLIPASRTSGGVHTEFGKMVVKSQPVWEKGTLAIRPERIRICIDKPKVNGVQCQVREVIYRGDHLNIFVEPGELRVRTTPMAKIHTGQEIWLELAPEHLEVLVD